MPKRNPTARARPPARTEKDTAPSAKTRATRLALMRAAEQLFAERGVDNVSLRDVADAAGQANHAAALYHFGGKRELIEAMLARHSGPVDEGFVPALDALRATGKEDLRAVVACLVRPMAAILDDPDGGVAYLLVCAELVNSRTHPLNELEAANGPGALELGARMLALMPEIDGEVLPLRMMRSAALLFYSIAAYHRLTAAGHEFARERFENDLIDALVALCTVKS